MDTYINMLKCTIYGSIINNSVSVLKKKKLRREKERDFLLCDGFIHDEG